MNSSQKKSATPYKSYAILLISVLVILITSYILYSNIEWMFKWSTQQRVMAIVNTAALQFDPDELDEINEKSVGTDVYIKTVKKLQSIKYQNKTVRFAYIQRKTEDPTILEFVADADSINPDAQVDLNGDGIINDADSLNSPGEEYDVSEYPDFIEIAFVKTYVDDELSTDVWGSHLSATAPIPNRSGQSQYLIGIDVDISDFNLLENIAFYPYTIFIIFILLILISLTHSLVRIWGTQVRLLEELDRQKDELLSIVSHQLATPVSSMKWYTEMLIDGDLGKITKEQKEHLMSMQGIATNLSDLVSMILDVSRVQLGRIRIEKQELDLANFFKEIIEIIEPKAKEKNIQFKISLPKKFPKAMLDKRYTHMTIENLLSNAIKYTPEKGVVDFVVELKGNILFCKVSDTGCGIPKADQEKIFGKLFRASNVRNTVDGNGFGLFVAKGAVESQGGKIWFNSEEGKGTKFFVELPIK